MRLLARPQRLADAIAPLRTLNCLLGLRVFEYPRGQPRYALSLAYVLLLIGLYWGTLYVQHEHYANLKLLKLEYFLYELMSYIIIGMVTYEMSVGWYHTKRLGVCYRKISVIDETLRRLGSTIDYGGMYYCTIGAIIAWLLFILLASCLQSMVLRTHTSTQTTICLILAFVYALNVSSIIIFEFCLSVRCLQTRFELLNELLSDGIPFAEIPRPTTLIEQNYVGGIANAERRRESRALQRRSQVGVRDPASETRDPAGLRFPSSRLPQFRHYRDYRGRPMTDHRRRKYLLQTAKQLHLELRKVSNTLCASFGIRLSLELGQSVMFVTGILYNLYVRFILRQSVMDNLVEQAFMAIMLGIGHVLKVVSVNYLCKHAADEGNRTSEIIHAIHKSDADDELREEIQQFALQMAHSPVRFYAFGVSLNYHILGSCLKTVTTYLVIMIQMSNSLESEGKKNGRARGD